MTYQHCIFDMDKTITPARAQIEPHVRALLSTLPTTVTVISGGHAERIKTQTENVADFILGACGNEAFSGAGTTLWRNQPLLADEKTAILEHIDSLVALLDHDLNHAWDPIEDRGTQITFSPLGNTAPVEQKHVYDPDMKKRLMWLEQAPFNHPSLSVVIGGSTSLDYYRTGCDKGAHVQKLIDHQGWNPAECVYFGDGLFPGGNDESVIGVIDTIAVTAPSDTVTHLRAMFNPTP